MVISCWVNGCVNRRDSSVRSFHRIPKVRVHEGEQTKELSVERRRLWLANINRKVQPSATSTICSDHFISGKPADLYDKANPDWAPTLNLTDLLTPRKSKKKKQRIETDRKRYDRAQERGKTKVKHQVARALLELASDPGPEVNFTAVPLIDLEEIQSEPAPVCQFMLTGNLEPHEEETTKVVDPVSQSQVDQVSQSQVDPVRQSQVDSEVQRLLIENQVLRDQLCDLKFNKESFEDKPDKVRFTMDAYFLLLYVNKMQEDAIKTLFAMNSWLYCKSDTQLLCPPVNTFVQYNNSVNCMPNNYTVSGSSDSYIYTTHGGLIGPTEIDIKPQEKKEPVNTTGFLPNVGSTEVQAGIEGCSARLSRLSSKEEKTCETPTRKKSRVSKNGRLNSQDTNLESNTSSTAKTRDVSKDSQSEIRKDKDIKVESTNDTDDIKCIPAGGTDRSVAKKVIKSENDPVHGNDADAISDMSENDGDYKPSEEGDAAADDNDDNGIKKDNKVTFPCDKCKKTYKLQSGYLNHLKDGVCKGVIKKNRKNAVNGGTRSYYCEVCKKTYSYERNYNAHFVEGRCNKQCKYCDKVLSKDMLKKHVFYQHDLLDERFRCKICQKRFFAKRELTIHMLLHGSNRNFVCDICGKAFFTYSSLYAHRKKHTENPSDRKAYCNLCNKEFNDKNYLYFYHMKVTHSSVRNCMCEICGKKFKTDHSVKHHMKSHSKERPFQCDICSKYYKSIGQLNNHKKLYHSKLKRCFCNVCNKGFFYEIKLKDHMNIHSGTRAHTCPHCNYSTYTADQLHQHRKKHKQPKNDLQKAETAIISPEKLPEETIKDQKVVAQTFENIKDSFPYKYSNHSIFY